MFSRPTVPHHTHALAASQTAVAQEVISEEDQEMLRLLEQAGALGNREGSSAQAAGEGGALETAPRVDQESAEASVLEMNEKMGTEEEGASQMFYDKYTRVFVPVSVRGYICSTGESFVSAARCRTLLAHVCA